MAPGLPKIAEKYGIPATAAFTDAHCIPSSFQISRIPQFLP
jgi:hypothetical protein